MTTTEKFWAKVHKTDSCWVWDASGTQNGYGQFWFRGKLWLAHRVSWILANGTIPNGLFVLHACDNKPCVNPNHLYLGTNSENIKRAAQQGVLGKACGERNGHCKLTDEQVRRLLADRRSGMDRDAISEKYKISRNYVYALSYGWRRKTAHASERLEKE